MSTKTNTPARITATNKKTGKHPQISKTHDAGHKPLTASPAKEVLLLSKGDIVEVTVIRTTKAEGQKHTSPIISSPGQKTERKKSTISNSEIPLSWGSIFGEQNLLYMKAQSFKQNKDTNKNSNAERIQQNRCNHVQKHTGTISSKGTSSREKSRKNSQAPCIFVQDRAVQCPEISNNTNRFAEFNPVHTLSFLIKELKDLVIKKDDRTCEIFTEMEQVLFRIPVSPAKPIFEDLKLDTLEAGTLQLKESSKQMKALCKSWVLEREKFQSLIREQDTQIQEANQKQKEVVLHAEVLTQKLEEVTRVRKAQDEVISALKRQIDDNERIISDLKVELITQTELARLNEYLIMDKDKLSKLSSYKDTLIIEYQKIIIDLQSQIEKLKLRNLNEVFANEGSTSSQVSAIQTGLAYSSPTSSFSGHSNKSWHDLTDVSTVEHASQEHVTLNKDTPIRDSARLEFVSLLDGESSHTIIPDHNQVTKPIISDMRKQGYDIHNRIPVNVPSPLRDYPHPDWSDSSLPSVSTVSDLDMVPSNDI
ncbi:epidermal growth factor receptor substrate 15 homolog isoform X2 [Polyergus mexicanus]|uniref:epidermal growth factor receptor substrate 15 homolog isoform X2 n=1 Tax=Polyergus mexicanus TaxID=615972 RepID=UPI0038B56AAA